MGKIVYGPGGKKLFYIDGVEVPEEEFHVKFPSRIKDLLRTTLAKKRPVPGGHLPGNWPATSEAMACNPQNVEKANAILEKAGVTGARHDETGMLHLADRGARRDVMRLRKLHDRSGGYGD